jgi:hypothetical protein
MVEALLERASELQELQEALVAADGGAGHGVVIQGPAGIGKSALLGFACDSARESGLRVLSARGSEFGRMYPWGIVRSLFAPTLAVPEAERAHVFDDAAALADVPLGSAGPPRRSPRTLTLWAPRFTACTGRSRTWRCPSGSWLSSTMRTGPTVPPCAGSNTWLRPSTTFRFCCVSGSIRRT